MPLCSAALRKAKHDILRALANGAGRPLPGGRVAAVLLGRWLDKSEDRLFAALGGAISFQLLDTASSVGLFALLDHRPGLRVEEIAAALGIGAYPTRILLLGLVPLGIVERIDDRHYNDPLLSGLLSGRIDEGGLRKMIDYFREVVNPAALHLRASVEEGAPVGLRRLFGDDAPSFYEAIGRDEARGACFREAMAADTRPSRDTVARSAVFARSRRILDVGGNTGDLALAIAAHHPHVHVTVLDFPETAARARERFRAMAVEDRLSALGADILERDLPSGYDAVLFAHFLDILSPEKLRRLLSRAFACLPEGGQVVVFGSVMRDDERGPRMYGVLSAYFLCLAGGEGRFYTAREITAAMREAGFVDVARSALPRSEVVLSATRPRSKSGSDLAALVRLGRPGFLVYSALFYALGGAAAAADRRPLDFGRWAHAFAFVAVAHLMTHFCNEYFDLPADAQNPAPTRWTGGSRVLVEGRLRPSVSLGAAFVLLFAALGLALAMPGAGMRAIAFGVLSLAWFYSAPPFSANYRAAGEVTVAAVLGVGVPLLAYEAQGAELAVPAALIAALAPLAIAQVARMLVMNLCDAEGDGRAGKRTLAVALGPPRARRVFALGQVAVLGATLAAWAAGALPAGASAAMLAPWPLGAWLSLRLRAGAPRGPAEAEALAFWATTHVALLAAAAALGLLASARAAPSSTLWFSAAFLAVPVAILCLQIGRRLAGGRA
jgi:1,4-dihydroxy-2-naphthoate octaprenyltransferase